jgi:hypothetical protein
VANDLPFVHRAVRALREGGVDVWVFGGWAEELLALAPPRAHADLDLLHPGPSFAAADALIAELHLEEVAEMHLPHKRAFLFEGVTVELFLVRRDEGGYYTEFGGGQRYDWPDDVFAGDGIIPLAGRRTVADFRENYPERPAA